MLRVIREMIFHKATERNTDISKALEHVQKVLKRKSIIFLISDFWDTSYQQPMRLINKKHDLINIQILDKAEISIPAMGMIKLHDVEKQSTAWIDAHKVKLQTNIANQIKQDNIRLKAFCKKNRIDFISIDSNKGYIQPLEEFFNNRMNRY